MMKKPTLLFFFLLCSTDVFAEWVVVGFAGVNDDITQYVDQKSIQKQGNKVKIGRMLDYSKVQTFKKYSFLSSVSRHEYDCVKETTRLLDLTLYSGNMKKGDVTYSHKNIKAKAYSMKPETVDEYYFKMACHPQ
jgi:hypothetical protein